MDVTAGFGSPNLVNTATWVEKNLTDKTEHPLKAISYPPAAVVDDEDRPVVVDDEDSAVANDDADSAAVGDDADIAVANDDVVAPDEELASTGTGDKGNVVAAALLAILAGGLMVAFGRRRHELR